MSNNPSEVLATLPAGPSREQTEKTLHDKYPGHIAWATDRANFSGCRAVSFYNGGWSGLTRADDDLFIAQAADAVDAVYAWYDQHELEEEADDTEYVMPAEDLMNLYFSTRANLLVVQQGFTADGDIKLLITTQLDAEDLEDFQAIQQETQVGLRKMREKRAARYAEQRRAQIEHDRLAEVGRKYEENLKHNLPKEA